MEFKSTSKGKAFACLVAHRKVNSNDLLQLRRPDESLNPHWCILCKRDGESIDHLFLHYPFTSGMWHKLFRLGSLVWDLWVSPRSLEYMFISTFKGFGNSARHKT